MYHPLGCSSSDMPLFLIVAGSRETTTTHSPAVRVGYAKSIHYGCFGINPGYEKRLRQPLLVTAACAGSRKRTTESDYRERETLTLRLNDRPPRIGRLPRMRPRPPPLLDAALAEAEG